MNDPTPEPTVPEPTAEQPTPDGAAKDQTQRNPVAAVRAAMAGPRWWKRRVSPLVLAAAMVFSCLLGVSVTALAALAAGTHRCGHQRMHSVRYDRPDDRGRPGDRPGWNRRPGQDRAPAAPKATPSHP